MTIKVTRKDTGEVSTYASLGEVKADADRNLDLVTDLGEGTLTQQIARILDVPEKWIEIGD